MINFPTYAFINVYAFVLLNTKLSCFGTAYPCLIHKEVHYKTEPYDSFESEQMGKEEGEEGEGRSWKKIEI